MSINCGMIAEALEKLAPRELAESWDNVGLLIGSPKQVVKQILLTLDITAAVVQEAIDRQADMIVSHHPFPFHALKSIRTDTTEGKLLQLLLKHDVAVYAAHTNLDSAWGGVNDALAALLQLEDIEPLQKAGLSLVKIVTFVPVGHEQAVYAAMIGAGAGHIGGYSHCSFQVSGTGTFMPEEGSQPFIGQQHQLVSVEEVRLETVAPSGLTDRIVQAMIAAHPYEEVAYDLYPLQNQQSSGGMGRVGNLVGPMTLDRFSEFVKQALSVDKVRVVGDLTSPISKVAVCGGSGMDVAKVARSAGAQVLVTGDIRYHDAQQAATEGLALVDAGHFATEVPVLPKLEDYLRDYFSAQNDELMIAVAGHQADIWQFI